ncbi:MAG: hypothetical protein K9K35_17095, partial [Rhodoferax sp.]|nr:hypothetical protein [Rhodoferax sp.]
WTHQLTGLSDEDCCLQYRITGTPQPMRIPVWNYRARICVQPLAGATTEAPQNQCLVRWEADFETEHEADMQARAGQVFERGFSGLRACLEGPGAEKPDV